MLALLRIAARVVEALVAIPVRAFRLFLSTILFNPRLGRLRFLVAPVILYVVFALAAANGRGANGTGPGEDRGGYREGGGPNAPESVYRARGDDRLALPGPDKPGPNGGDV